MKKFSMISGLVWFWLAWLFAPAGAMSATPYTVVGSHRSDILVLKGENIAFPFETRFRGPGWGLANNQYIQGVPRAEGDARVYADDIVFTKGKDTLARWKQKQTVKKTGANTFDVVYEVTPEQDFVFGIPGKAEEPKGTISFLLAPSPFFKGGRVALKTKDGEKTHTLPPPRGSEAGVTSAILTAPSGETATLTFDPAVFLHRDAGELRFMMDSNGKTVPAGKTYEQRIAVQLPDALRFEPENRWVDTSDWFPVDVDNDFSKPSEIGMEDWLEKPAGKRGWLKMDGDRIVHEDGTPFKLWGVNMLRANNSQINAEYMVNAPAAAAHYGANINRLHAFAKPHNKKWAHMFKLMDEHDSFKFHEEHLDLFDKIFHESKKRGIYTGWSVFYGWFPSQADIEEGRFLNWEEAQTMLRKPFPRAGSFYGAACVMPDVQDLIIQWHVKLLNHVNPYTGMRYADDAALAFVELQNEENAYLQIRNLEGMLKDAPTYRKLYYGRFASFLKEKYGDDEGLRKAWGGALKANESLAEANISPFPGWYDPSRGSPGARTADQYHFIYRTQEEYYLKFKEAVRETGYGGLLVGSCWQASDWLGHLYNTYLDSQVGMIDRHNYGRDHLDKPGTGLLSAGFQQVANRPFNYSEWGGSARVGRKIVSPITAIYGMGLQGWDGSEQFAWDYEGVLPHDSTNINNSCNPFHNLAQYMTLSRLVHRGDVQEGAVAGLRRVSLPALKEKGDVGFHEEFSLLGNANHKSFEAAVPQESLAVGRVLLEFVDGPVVEPVADKTAGFIDRDHHVVRSNTGQLVWDISGAGFFRVDTPGTQAIIGNIGGQTHRMKDVDIAPRSPYGHIYVTALDKDADIATGRRLLVTAIGRAVPEGTKFDDLAYTPMESPRDTRKVPLLIEPVRASIAITRRGPATVTPLDQNGRKVETLKPLPVKQGTNAIGFDVDTSETKSVYYLVEFVK